MYIQKALYTVTCRPALHVIGPHLKPPKCPWTGKWINKLWNNGISVRNKLLTHNYMDESENDHAEWRKLTKIKYHDSIYMKLYKIKTKL